MSVIAVDLGGTKIKAALVSTTLHIRKSITLPTQPHKGKLHVLRTIDSLTSTLLREEKNITAIGLSLPGIVRSDGKQLFAGNILSCLEGVNLKKRLEKKFSLPVVVANDAACFTLAEATMGTRASAKKILGIIWGSGLGAGLALRNENAWTLFDAPLEIGQNHTRNYISKKPQRLEELIGGYYVLNTYTKQTGKRLSSVADLYAERTPLAKQLIADMLLQLGKTLANLTNTFHPDIIILGGGVSQLPEPAYKILRGHIKQHALPMLSKQTRLQRYSISNDAGLLGAALLALQ
jgi:glucokinase